MDSNFLQRYSLKISFGGRTSYHTTRNIHFQENNFQVDSKAFASSQKVWQWIQSGTNVMNDNAEDILKLEQENPKLAHLSLEGQT